MPANYPALLGEIKQRIRSAQYEALKAVNKELIALYWDIGRLIMERQTGETWGKSVVGNLSNDLQREFLGISGFSVSNLWRMKLFYAAYADVVDAAFQIHKGMGPGLLESVYEIVLAHALKKRGLKVERQVPVEIVFGNC